MSLDETTEMDETLSCPWCGFRDPSDYAIQLHIEEHHTEDSPFAVPACPPSSSHSKAPRKSAARSPSRSEERWTKCTRQGCGEVVSLAEADEHLATHEAIAAVEDEDCRPHKNTHSLARSSLQAKAESKSPSSAKQLKRESQHKRRPASPNRSPVKSIRRYFFGVPPSNGSIRNPLQERREKGRLGTEDLGPHAFEKKMPADVRRALETGARPVHENHIDRRGQLVREVYIPNETSDLIRVLADLCSLDGTTTAHFCHPGTKHVRRIRCDGNFCGYWNIQMLLSYLHAAGPAADPPGRRLLPTVPQIQATIEAAWANGICAYGRTETGGILDSRKWIGTHEAAAYFMQTGVAVAATSFRRDVDTGRPAHAALLDSVEAYFLGGGARADGAVARGSAVVTQLPPIYLQRAGHSMTIVGLERRADGRRSLMVFDPSFETSETMMRLVEGRSVRARPETLLQAYRKGEDRLAEWREYEILALSGESGRGL